MPALAEDPPVALVVAEPPVVPDVVLDAAPVAPRFMPVPAEPTSGLAAPCSPAVVPGPARPALSVSAGDPDAAYALATAADMQPAINANMSFLIPHLPIERLRTATSP
jgi:hypothetical protein